MTKRTDPSTGRRLYADPIEREEPDMRRLVDLVLHLAESQHHAATRPRSEQQQRGTESPSAERLDNDAESKEQ